MLTKHEEVITRDAIRDLVQAANALEREFRRTDSVRLDMLAKAETALFKINRTLREAVHASHGR